MNAKCDCDSKEMIFGLCYKCPKCPDCKTSLVFKTYHDDKCKLMPKCEKCGERTDTGAKLRTNCLLCLERLDYLDRLISYNNKHSYHSPINADHDGDDIPIVRSKVCLVCLKPADKRCSKCKIALYCSIDCQRRDWNAGHKGICCKEDEHI